MGFFYLKVGKMSAGKKEKSYQAAKSTAPSPLMTVAEAAKYMRIKEKTLYAWIADERIPCLRAGSRLRFRLCDLERWLGVPPERRQ